MFNNNASKKKNSSSLLPINSTFLHILSPPLFVQTLVFSPASSHGLHPMSRRLQLNAMLFYHHVFSYHLYVYVICKQKHGRRICDEGNHYYITSPSSAADDPICKSSNNGTPLYSHNTMYLYSTECTHRHHHSIRACLMFRHKTSLHKTQCMNEETEYSSRGSDSINDVS